MSPGGLGGGRADPGTGRQLLRVSYYGAGGPGGPRLPRRPRPGRPGAVAALRYRRGRPHARPEDCQQAASGKRLRDQLERLGVYRPTGREHLNGCIVVPVREGGHIVQLYGRGSELLKGEL